MHNQSVCRESGQFGTSGAGCVCRPENTSKLKQSVQQSDLHILYWSNKGGRGGRVWEGRERRGSVRRDGGSVGREEGV